MRQIPTSFWKNVSQIVTEKQMTLQKRRYALRDSSGMPHFLLPADQLKKIILHWNCHYQDAPKGFAVKRQEHRK